MESCHKNRAIDKGVRSMRRGLDFGLTRRFIGVVSGPVPKLNLEVAQIQPTQDLHDRIWTKPSLSQRSISNSRLVLRLSHSVMTSIPKPDLIIPTSDATVDVKIIDGGRLTVPAAATYVWGPVLPGHEKFSAMSYAFFIENHAQKKRIMFDLGLRKDPENYAPVHSNFLKDPTKGAIVEVDKDVATQLQEGGIDLKSVDAIVWR